MPNGQLFEDIDVRKELMASLVCAWVTNHKGFRKAVQSAATDQALRDVLKKRGYDHEMNNQDIEAVLDFNRKTLKKTPNPMTPAQVDAELLSEDALGPGTSHLRG